MSYVHRQLLPWQPRAVAGIEWHTSLVTARGTQYSSTLQYSNPTLSCTLRPVLANELVVSSSDLLLLLLLLPLLCCAVPLFCLCLQGVTPSRHAAGDAAAPHG